jgi:hypothetical protein
MPRRSCSATRVALLLEQPAKAGKGGHPVSFYALPCLAVILPSQQNDMGRVLELWVFTALQSWRECFSTQSTFGASLYRFASYPKSVRRRARLGRLDGRLVSNMSFQPRGAVIATLAIYPANHLC